jgi:hypothetical protein
VEEPQVFFGYESRPELTRETLFAAADSITGTGLAQGRSWERLAVTGRIVIDQVFQAIDDSELAVFDVSTLSLVFRTYAAAAAQARA